MIGMFCDIHPRLIVVFVPPPDQCASSPNWLLYLCFVYQRCFWFKTVKYCYWRTPTITPPRNHPSEDNMESGRASVTFRHWKALRVPSVAKRYPRQCLPSLFLWGLVVAMLSNAHRVIPSYLSGCYRPKHTSCNRFDFLTNGRHARAHDHTRLRCWSPKLLVGQRRVRGRRGSTSRPKPICSGPEMVNSIGAWDDQEGGG